MSTSQNNPNKGTQQPNSNTTNDAQRNQQTPDASGTKKPSTDPTHGAGRTKAEEEDTKKPMASSTGKTAQDLDQKGDRTQDQSRRSSDQDR